MPRQAITQEELFLPLLRFVAERGGEVDRMGHDLLWSLAWELRLTEEEFYRETTNGRWQWKATVEYCREKLIEHWDAFEPAGREPGIWTLTRVGQRLAADPPVYMVDKWERWRQSRAVPPEGPRGVAGRAPRGQTRGRALGMRHRRKLTATGTR